jgi:methyl-accepting chemotaxis protein
MADKVAGAGAAIELVLSTAEESADRENEAVSRANGEVTAVLDDLLTVLTGFRESADQLEAATVGIRSEISESLVKLQFQDRVCQVLQHLRDSIANFPVVVARAHGDGAGPTRPLNAQALLDALASDYTMHEERRAHESGSATHVLESEITFF